MIAGNRRRAFRLFGRLPAGARRFIVRRVAPTWTAGAVAIIERSDGRWLMVKPVYRQGWSLPGGLIDRGEAAADAAVREVWEELGLRIRVEKQPWVVFDSTMRQVEMVFRGELIDEIDLDSVTVRSDELDDVGWFPPDELPPVERETLNVVAAIRESDERGSRILLR